MARLLLCILGLGLLAACNPPKDEKALSATELIEAPTEDGQVPVLSLQDSVYDFGEVTAGTIVKHKFDFVNTGKRDLLITNAQASCGCTVPTYPKEPIPPGGKGTIEVEFNSTSRVGNQNKTVTVFANTQPPTTELQIVGKVRANGDDGPVAE